MFAQITNKWVLIVLITMAGLKKRPLLCSDPDQKSQDLISQKSHCFLMDVPELTTGK